MTSSFVENKPPYLNAPSTYLLGVGELVHDSGYISDLNNLQVGHCSNVSTTLTQHIPPFEYTSDKIAICVGSTNDNKVQITGRNKEIWIRTMLYGEWGSWARIDNFECNTIADLITSLSSASNLSTLATALGGLYINGPISNESPDNIKSSGCWYSYSWISSPAGGNEGTLISVLAYEADSSHFNSAQIFFDANGDFYIRMHWYAGWSSWKKMSFE